jgi:hypothetical protein
MDAKGGGGSNDAAPDTSQDGGTGGAGQDTGAGGGTGGANPDASDGAAPDSSPTAPDVSVDGSAPDADASPATGDAPGPSSDADDAGPGTDDGPVVPPADGADAASPTLFSFTAPEPGNYGWATDHGTLAVINEGAPESPGGSLEYTADLSGVSQASVYYQYSPGDGITPPPVGTPAYAGYTTVHLRLRLRSQAPPQLLSITPFLIGGTRADEVNNFGDYLDITTPGLFAGNTWVETTIAIGNTGDGGTPLVPDIADLWKIGVTLALGDDAGAPAAPIVIDIDDIFVSR